MASKTLNKKCSTTIKADKIEGDNLSKKLQFDLERDLLRLFQNSLYCDIKLIINTSHLSTHSCILQTRAVRFYKYIFNEFEVLNQNGISVFNFYNASFSYLQTFIQNIYTNIHTANAEDSIIKHLQNCKSQSTDKVVQKSTSTLSESNPISSEIDLFFTPKCSPSELHKPFAPSGIKIKDSNVVSYYKIVSVDDIPTEDKLDEDHTRVTLESLEDEELEQELAEQDELLLSFKTIFTKKTEVKPNLLSYSNSSQLTKKVKPKVYKKVDSSKSNQFIPGQIKNKFLPRQVNISIESNSLCDKQSPVKNFSRNNRTRYIKLQNRDCHLGENLEAASSLCSSEMDVSTTGCDSGLDNSSSFHPETSPRETTASETSGVVLTEMTINDDIPNDEMFSANRSGSTETSLSSEMGTWDGREDLKAKIQFTTKTSDNGHARSVCTDNKNDDEEIYSSALNENELNRLDEMEKNIRDCEIFLYMERNQSDLLHRYWPWKSNDEIGEDFTENEKEYNNDVTPKFQISIKTENPVLRGEVDNTLSNGDSVVIPNDYRDNNSNDSIQNTNYCTLESFPNDVPEEYEHIGIQETRTPPCTPKKLKLENKEFEVEEKKHFPDVKSDKPDNNHSTGISNYFIDASSLLDDDELKSPPSISLVSVKTYSEYPRNESKDENAEPKTSKAVVSNFFYPLSETEQEKRVNELQEKERQQGDIIFKNSILHFSKHEVQDNQGVHKERLNNNFWGDNSYEDTDKGRPADSSIDPPNSINEADLEDKESACERNSLVETHFFDSSNLPSKSEFLMDDDCTDTNTINDRCDVSFHGPSFENSSSSSRRRNESAPIVSGGMDFVEQMRDRKTSRSQGEAWIVTFDDDTKTKSKFSTNTHSVGKSDNLKEKEVESISSSSDVNELGITKHDVVDDKETNSPSQNGFPVEKSSSLGYFLDFGKAVDQKYLQNRQNKVENSAEKKNMFSMFIEIDDNSKTSSLSRKPKKVVEKVNDKSCDDENSADITSMTSDVAENQEEMKRSFYMFIESDSPHAKRKQIPRNLVKFSTENSNKKTYLRTESYVVESQGEGNEKSKQEDCSSSDNSLLYTEHDTKTQRLSRGDNSTTNKSEKSSTRNTLSKITAWSETRVPKDERGSTESWLNTKDVLVKYTAKSNEQFNELSLKKDSTFIMGESKNRSCDKFSCENVGERLESSKVPDRDSGVGLNHEDNEVSFVKLSDMDSNRHSLNYQGTNRSYEKLSQSVSDTCTPGTRKEIHNGVTSLSKSTENNNDLSVASGFRINRSLSRLFPNLSSQSLASLSKRDINKGDKNVQGSVYSENNTSLLSSADPSGLDISTSETDVSSHAGNSSRLGEDLLRMFLEEIGPDVVVEVAGRRIKAHKCILSSRCQYFAATLSGGWVESTGNVISLQGFTYNAVHFALRYIYSGESRIPESLNIVELATLADMLCLDGLQEIISYNLKVKYCHSFHVPCSICSVGVLDCLPIAAAYGLEELYRKCLRWITKYFVKIWPTKSFGSLSKELLEKCYQHFVVHVSVDNVLDTVVNIDKVRGSLTNVRWAETVSRLVKKLYESTVRYIAEHFSSILISDNFLALGKEDGWNLGRIEDSLIEAIRYLPPEQACWSHAQLHRIFSVANDPDPPPEMDWNENFLKLLQVIAGLVESSLIKQAPRAAKSRAWRQLEPELRSRIQEAACLVLPDDIPSPGQRKSHLVRKSFSQSSVPQTARSRIIELKQIKLAMTKQVNRNQNTSRPLSLQIDQRSKNNTQFGPLRTSASTSSVRRSEPVEYIRKTQNKTQISANIISEPKKSLNSRYSEIKSRYLEPKSPQKTAPEKSSPAVPTSTTNQLQRRNMKCVSSSDSSRNYSPALRSSKTSVPQTKRNAGSNRQNIDQTVNSRKNRNLSYNRSETASEKLTGRINTENYISTDSLCTDSLLSEKEATHRRKSQDSNYTANGKENSTRTYTSTRGSLPVRTKVRSLNTENRSSPPVKPSQKFIMPSSKASVNEAWKSTPTKRPTSSKSPSGGNQLKRGSGQKAGNAACSPRNVPSKNSGKIDSISMNGNAGGRRKSDVDSENNKKSTREESQTPCGLSRSGTFLKEEPTILKKPQVIDGVNGAL